NNKLPPGNRHFIIEKNLAALIIHRADREQILDQYLRQQNRKTNTLRTWFNSILNGQFTEVSPGELVNYIKTNQIPYTIVDEVKKEETSFIPTEAEIEFLKDPELLELIDSEFDKKIVGEKESRLSIFINGCGKYVRNAKISSYNLCINSKSGAGKDHVTKNVLKIFPSSDVNIRSRISPTTLTYWHAGEKDWTWNGKILSLLDISNTVLNCDAFKLFLSDGTFSTVVIDQKAQDIEVKGKPVVFVTTASASPNNEALRRLPFLELDETIDQTKAIKKAQAVAAANGISLKYDKTITEALSKLQHVKVKIPFAEDLVDEFPDEHLIMRTHFSRLLDYIKASAALFQYQRDIDEDGFVIASTKDYDIARIPLKKTTSNPMMIPLSQKQKTLLAECKKLGRFSAKQIAPHAPFVATSKVYDALNKLQENGFLSSELEEKDSSIRPVRMYQYVAFEIKDIPTWNDICRKKGNKGSKENKEIRKNKGIKDFLEVNHDSMISPISPISGFVY
ncbi:unnamed protein product, partial [marine sediment metagenome]